MGRYLYTYDEKAGRIRPVHCVIWEQVHGREIPKGFDIHHIDGNDKNNDPSNLTLISHSDHIALHHKLRREGKDPVDPTNPDIIADREKHHKCYMNNLEADRRYKRKYSKEHKEEIAARAREYHQRNKEAIKIKRKIYKTENAEKIKAANKLYRETHREQRIEYNREYYSAHNEERSAYARERYQSKKDEIRLQQAEYKATHREERLAYNQRYREEHRELIRAKGRLYAAKKRGASAELIHQYEADLERLSKQS